MNKVMLMIVLMVVSVLAVSVEMARAQVNGLYVAPKIGYSWGDTDPGLSGVLDLNMPGIGAAVGYDFYQASGIPVRLDLEYFYRFESEKDYIGGVKGRETKFNWQTIMANIYYDFRNNTQLTPFVNGGLGLAYTSIKGKALGAPLSDSSSDFAWSLGAGISYAITDNLAMDISYRYIGVDLDVRDVDFHANEVLTGARFTF